MKEEKEQNKEIVDTMRSINSDKEKLNKVNRKLKITMIIMVILNFVAGILIASIYFWIKDIIFLIIGGLLILLIIPTFFIFKNISNKIKQ